MQYADFSTRLVNWQKQFGRHQLPWQNTTDPYHIWLSEIMLQQTQVATVIPYYLKFLKRFPTIDCLAQADIDEVLCLWAGLGYYSRARNLHRCAQQIVQDFNSIFPENERDLISLSGIGRSTAAAILAFAFAKRAAILDGNVKRVLTRVFAIKGFPGEKQVEAQLWQLAEQLLPPIEDTSKMIRPYTQGLMDLGAMICSRKPRCELCPFEQDCLAHIQGIENQLPYPRPKKVMPVKQVWMGIFCHYETILLERRLNKGLWGGLWSFPEYSTEQMLQDDLIKLKKAKCTKLTSFKHTFTHFKLIIHPMLVQCAQFEVKQQENQEWVLKSQLAKYGMPKPIQKILKEIEQINR